MSTVALAACGDGDTTGNGGGGTGGTGEAPFVFPAPEPFPTSIPYPAAPQPPTPNALQSRTSLNILTLGMSVFLGDDLVGYDNPYRATIVSDYAPSRYFAKALLYARPDRAVREQIAAVGGSFDDQTPGQYAGATGKPYDVTILGLAMNSGSAYGVHGRGPNAAFTKERLRALLVQIKADGGTPVLCNTIHPWPEKTTPELIRSALSEGIAWPPEQQTLLFGGALTFDRDNNLFGSPTLSADGRGIFERDGGQSIRAGSQLMIESDSGGNAGVRMTVTRRLSGTTVEVDPGSIRQSGASVGYVRHFNPPVDEFLVPPPAQQVQTRDWTGAGISVAGIVSYATWNAILADLAREQDVKLIDLEYRGFKWVEQHGWPSVYRSVSQGVVFETYNHPQWAAQRIIYGEMMTWLAGELDANRLFGGYERLRGPVVT
ncbi:hypothetical protein [Sphingomonas sp. R86521]|uniref:hypothetical protein n=1 Tax=Sphingomonas sp. R86521 TaxID=3093860 RepID=UPI0036D21EC5